MPAPLRGSSGPEQGSGEADGGGGSSEEDEDDEDDSSDEDDGDEQLTEDSEATGAAASCCKLVLLQHGSVLLHAADSQPLKVAYRCRLAALSVGRYRGAAFAAVQAYREVSDVGNLPIERFKCGRGGFGR